MPVSHEYLMVETVITVSKIHNLLATNLFCSGQVLQQGSVMTTGGRTFVAGTPTPAGPQVRLDGNGYVDHVILVQ